MYIYCIYIYIKSLTSKAVFLTHFTDFGIEHFTCTIYNRVYTIDCSAQKIALCVKPQVAANNF